MGQGFYLCIYFLVLKRHCVLVQQIRSSNVASSGLSDYFTLKMNEGSGC